MQPGQVPWLYAVDDQTDIALAVAQARGTGASGMKIYANLPGNLVAKLVAEGKRQHFPVWSHLQVYPASPYDSLGATAVSHACMIALCTRVRQGAVRPQRRAILRGADGGRPGHHAAISPRWRNRARCSMRR
ncbi:hypothetical protein LP420_31655 [Massilia sp. B-10]|nr:hypothetical protein LP420_31655 [Massilia sp. B-10]